VRSLGILYAAETLVPPRGGAERFALELIEALNGRHAVETVFLDGEAPPGDGYWAAKRARREAVAAAVREELAGASYDVVATTLHAGPGAVAAAAAENVPAVLFLHSYEHLCKYAYDAGSRCVPESCCRDCPRAAALAAAERDELMRSRRDHATALATATALVATSAAVADETERWSGRRPEVVPGALRDVPAARADIDGPVVLAAASWHPNKGRDLLESLAGLLTHRTLAITAGGLGAELAERLRARPNVRLVPNAPIGELLDGAAALLVPSQWREPFGRIAFEGMAAGIPTLASATGGLLELVPPEQLVDPPDGPERWRDAVDALLEPPDWDAARARGREAAGAVLARDPVGALEDLLLGAAATAGGTGRPMVRCAALESRL
jgi:glycosyltransferase involved in cell wall biosynthesis